MGEFIPDGIDNPAQLELYYIDATGKSVYEQKIDLDIPATHDDNGDWRQFDVHLENQPMADVFFMEFRFTGLNGDNGSTVYYIDDVTWGVATTGLQQTQTELDWNLPMYNALGMPVEGSNYHGIVVQKGRKFFLK